MGLTPLFFIVGYEKSGTACQRTKIMQLGTKIVTTMYAVKFKTAVDLMV